MRRVRHPARLGIAVQVFASLLSLCACAEGGEPSGPAGAPAPEILSLSAVPSLIDYGQSAELLWKTTGAGRVQLRDGPLTLLDTATAPNGLFSVSPELTTTYTLVASGERGEVEAKVKVSVRPTVLHLETNVSGEVVIGRPVLLRWRTGGARELLLRSGETDLQSIPESKIREGSLWVAAPENGVFTLIARSGELESTRSVGVSSRRLDPPLIERFDATPSVVTRGRGDEVEIVWEVKDASSISLQVGAVVIDLAGLSSRADQIVLPILDTNEVSLVATNPAGRDQQGFVVQAVDPPSIEFFRSSQRRIPAGHAFELSWGTVGVEAVALLLDGEIVEEALPPSGTTVRTLGADATFTLRASNLAGAFVEEELLLSVGPPLIHRFEADREMVAALDPLSLEWEVLGGVSLSILDPEGAPIDACHRDDLLAIMAGSCVVEAPGLLGSYDYELVVVDASQEASSRLLTIRVIDGPTIEAFGASPSSLDLGGSVTLSWKTEPDRDGLPATLDLRDDQGNQYDLSGLDPLEDSIEVQPVSPGLYRFTLEAETPETTPASETATARVWALASAELDGDLPIFDPILGHYEVELRFSTENATTLQLWVVDMEGNLLGEPLFATEDPVELESGTLMVQLEETTTYRLLVTNGNGTQSFQDLVVAIEGDLGYRHRWP